MNLPHNILAAAGNPGNLSWEDSALARIIDSILYWYTTGPIKYTKCKKCLDPGGDVKILFIAAHHF